MAHLYAVIWELESCYLSVLVLLWLRYFVTGLVVEVLLFWNAFITKMGR